MHDVVVITPTLGRSTRMKECIESVLAQDFTGTVCHYLVGDHLSPPHCSELGELCESYGPAVRFLNYEEQPIANYVPERCARVRNHGIAQTDSKYVAQIDDDNTFDPPHLVSLVAILEAEPDVGIAFSWRRVLREDGSPCRLRRYPWVITEQTTLAKEVFRAMEAMGIFKEGSCIIRDPEPGKDDDLFHVDSSEWVIRRNVFERVQYAAHVSARDKIYGNMDDYLFCRDAYRAGVRFKCSRQVTLNYYLGGHAAGHSLSLES